MNFRVQKGLITTCVIIKHVFIITDYKEMKLLRNEAFAQMLITFMNPIPIEFYIILID